MYIGPWQEYKLAKILEMKSKLEKESLDQPETAPTSSKNPIMSEQRRLPPLSNSKDPSVRSTGVQRQNSNSLRRTTKRSTNSIDQHYKKWRRFDHALEYGQRLELKERLKDFDPPNLHTYFPNEVIKTMRPTRPPLPKPVNPELKREQAREEQLKRMERMREMYGIKKSQSREEIEVRAPRGRQAEKKQKPLQTQRVQDEVKQQEEEKKDTTPSLPKIKEKPQDIKPGLYSYYYQKYMASEIQKHQLKLPDSPQRQKLFDVRETDIEKSGELIEEIDKIVKWAQRLPDDVK